MANQMEAIESAKQASNRRDTPEGIFAASTLKVGSLLEAVSILLLWLLKSESCWLWRWIVRNFVGRRDDEMSDEEAMAAFVFAFKS